MHVSTYLHIFANKIWLNQYNKEKCIFDFKIRSSISKIPASSAGPSFGHNSAVYIDQLQLLYYRAKHGGMLKLEKRRACQILC